MDDKDYYYVTYMGLGMGGCMIMEQHRPADGSDNPDGFNIAEATKFLRNYTGMAVVIQAWVKTTKRRKEDFEKFVHEATGAPAPTKDRPSHLSVVPEPQDNTP